MGEDDDVVEVVLELVEGPPAGDQPDLGLGEVAPVDGFGGELVLRVAGHLVDDEGSRGGVGAGDGGRVPGLDRPESVEDAGALGVSDGLCKWSGLLVKEFDCEYDQDDGPGVRAGA